MRYMFEEYGGVIINGIVASFLTLIFFGQIYPSVSSLFSNTIENLIAPNSVTLNDQLYAPTLVVSSCVISKDAAFDYHNYCSAYSNTGKSLISLVEIVKGNVDTSTPGKYEVTFKVTYQGVSTYRKGVFLVEERI